ncbi:MAG: ABC transporter permease, partial [Rhizobacter sp.]
LIQAERFGSNGPRPSAVQQNVPAWLVFGMFFVIASLSGLVVEERNSGALARLHSLGVPRSVMLASKALPYLGVNAVQAALMLAVGVWLMPWLGGDALSLAHIHWGALLAALLAISIAAVSMALALACAVRTHAQAAAVGPIANVLMAAIGGIMVPKFVMPTSMQRLAELSPMNWGLEALLNVLLRSGDVASTLPHVLRLGGFAVLMFGIALLLFQRPAR